MLWTSTVAGAQDAGSAEAELSEEARLARRIERVREDRGHEAAEAALGHAARALSEAEAAGVRGEPAVEARALSIAEAAVILAERVAARARARMALEDARARSREAERRRAAAREALEAALAQRAAGSG